jgi:hypothetical protein
LKEEKTTMPDSVELMGECLPCGSWFSLTPKRKKLPKHERLVGYQEGHTAFPISGPCSGSGKKPIRARFWDKSGKLKDVEVPK